MVAMALVWASVSGAVIRSATRITVTTVTGTRITPTRIRTHIRTVYSPYGYPAYGYPTANGSYGNPAQPTAGSVGVQPGQQATTGGVSFEITPGSAAVSVDGTYVGTVANFSPTSQPLGLTPGRHHIEIRAAGYRALAFDADVTPGQVTPYQGTLQAQGN